MKIVLKTLVIMAIPAMLSAQSGKVQTAWRQLGDYNTSKDVSSLMKAKEAIDLAANHENTKNEAKTWSYRAQIYYALFKNALDQEDKKLTSAVADKNDRLTKAYGNVSTVDLEESQKSLMKLVELDKDQTYLKSMEIQQMQVMAINDVSNLAVGKFKAEKYAESAQYFSGYYTAIKMMGKKDTASINNALLCYQRLKDYSKIKEINQMIIKDKVATPYNFVTLYDAQLETKDTTGAQLTLIDGREAFPNDGDLLNREIEYQLKQGKDVEALANLDKAIAKSPNSAIFWLVRGNIYDKQANPKDAAGKEKEKPKNFDELMGKAETNYKKAAELEPKNGDSWYNLGALYNNWGGVAIKKCDDLIKQATKMKECEAQANDKFNKAIPALEKALEFNPTDKSIMMPLRKLYLMTDQPEKAQAMNDRINGKK